MDARNFDNPLNGLIADDKAPSKEAAAVQHCLVYLSGELRKLGLSQAAKLLDDAVRSVSDAQRFCEFEREYHLDAMSARHRPRDAGQKRGAADRGDELHGTAYMIPGE
ncbi:MAG: hypothetical protein R3F55_17065 [Alphaproteobacteria bacterium]